jgi:hypothetical protein
MPPILNDDGAANGVVCSLDYVHSGRSRQGGPNPRLFFNLPLGLPTGLCE